jgi:hypothetical protein
MGELEDAAEQAKLIEHLQGRRHDAIAAELAAEVGVTFEQRDGHALSCEQQGEHDPGRPAADNAAGRVLESWATLSF